MRKLLTSKWTKVIVFLLACVPVALLAIALVRNNLGPNPVETLQNQTGEWTLKFLVMTLAVTPLRKILKLPDLIRFRRMLGLFAFFYVCLHFVTYLWLDQTFNFRGMLDDVAKRKFITVGFTAFLLLIPLALTSTTGMIRRLGGKRWQALHRAIYLCGILGVIHYWWKVKSDIRGPLFYAVLVGILLLYRLWDSYARGKGRAVAPVRAGVSATD